MKTMIRGLIHGNFRQWGPTQYSQYSRTLGHCNKVGIELEIKEPLTPYQGKRLLEENIKLSRITSLLTLQEQIDVTIADKDEYEIQYLFDVSNPNTFYEEVVWLDNLLRDVGIMTWGSTHVNIQIKRNQKRRDKYIDYGEIHHDIIGDADLYKRIEFKSGPIWTNAKELIAGIITISSKRADIAAYCDKIVRPKMCDFVEVYKRCYSK